MKKFTLTSFILLAAIFCIEVVAQKYNGGLQPGRMYKSGERVYTQRFGFSATVPEGWEGMLPRESEVFLLSTITETFGEIYVFGQEKGDLISMQTAWKNGFSLTETVSLKSSASKIENELLLAEVTAEGKYINKGFKGFAVSKCGNNACITTLMVAPVHHFESVKNTIIEFMKGGSFQTPTTVSPYQNLDWTEFLSNKVLMSYLSVQAGSKETIIHLCADGSFISDVKQHGLFKNEEKGYRGNNSGTWTAKGEGDNCTLDLTFNKKKLPVLQATLSFKDEKLYSHGERYFAGKSEVCK